MRSDWKKTTIDEICARIYSGGTPSTKETAYWNGDINWLSSGETRSKFIYETERKITKLGVEQSSTQLAFRDSIVIATAGQGYTRGQASFLKIDTYVNQSVLVLEADRTMVEPLFLYYNLSNRYEELRQLSDGTSTRGGLSGWIVRRMMIKLPPIDIQKKIIDVLYAIDQKIECNIAINKNLEEQAQAVFDAWFVNYIPWQSKRPVGWESGVLGDYVTIKRGGSPRPIHEYLTDHGLSWLKISDATSIRSPYILDIKECIKESGLRKTVFLNAGALVLSNSATPGIPKILDVDCCIHDGWLYFPQSHFSNVFLYLFFKHIRKNLVQRGNGSVFTNLKTELLKDYPIFIPNQQTLIRFDEFVTPMFQQMKQIVREIRALSELRDALLPRLMSGELDVSNIEL